nr:hypothetical protein [Nocardia carnea]
MIKPTHLIGGYAQQRCAEEEPEVREMRPGQYAACHFPLTGG